MKKSLLIGAIAMMAASLMAADSSPKDDLTAAAKKLGAQDNYSWTMTLDLGPNSQFTPGPTLGKTEKGGYTWLSVTFNDNTTEGLSKGDKVAVKTEDGWKPAAEAGGGGGGGGGFNPAAFMGRRMKNLKAPATELEDLVSKAGEIKQDGDVYSGDLTKEGATVVLKMGGRRNAAQAPEPTEAKGSLKVWLKGGALTKYEFKVSGKMEINGDTRDIERTTTVEIKDVGSTKVDAPEEAKKVIS